MNAPKFLPAGCALSPPELVAALRNVGAVKARLTAGELLVRGALAGALLAVATTLALSAAAQTGLPIVGAAVFPVGFVMLVLLGLELLTGNFLLLPLACARREATLGQLVRNWCLVFVGNLLGSLLYASLYVGLGGVPESVSTALSRIAEAKTVAYAAQGASGLSLVIARAVLCNWLVTLGVVMSMVSRSVPGKVVAMWLPIFTFFAQGFEHSVVNMFVIPAGIWSGANVTVADWWLWNQLPVTLGNLLGALLLTAVPVSYRR